MVETILIPDILLVVTCDWVLSTANARAVGRQKVREAENTGREALSSGRSM